MCHRPDFWRGESRNICRTDQASGKVIKVDLAASRWTRLVVKVNVFGGSGSVLGLGLDRGWTLEVVCTNQSCPKPELPASHHMETSLGNLLASSDSESRGRLLIEDQVLCRAPVPEAGLVAAIWDF